MERAAAPERSWIADGLIVAPSRIHGKGVLTTRKIGEGELLIVWGGEILTQRDINEGRGRRHTVVAIDEGLFLSAPATQELSIDDYMNHSCSPNAWMRDAISLEAACEIVPGEEITADYAIWLDDPDYVMKNPCNCGAAWCRSLITGMDWTLPDVQARYFPHFSPFLNRRILRFENTPSTENREDRQ